MRLSDLDRAIVNRLQDGIPVCPRPYASLAKELGTTESLLLDRLNVLNEDRVMSRFGPMYDAAAFGGAYTLAAMVVPDEQVHAVSEVVNSKPLVAHNYLRDHQFNMWFVIAAENQQQITDTILEIEAESGLPVYDFPKQEEFYVGAKFYV